MQEIYVPGNAPDYILIQSSAISATEALTRARTGRPKNMSNVLLYLKPNEITSDYKVLDLSGNGNNALLTGGKVRKVIK